MMRRFLALLLAMGCLAGPARAVQCDATVEALPGKTGYGPRQGDARCEGLFASPVGAPPVEIVSVTRGDPVFDPAKLDRLTISLAVSDPGPGPVHVRAVGLPVNVFYRMDADLDPGHTLAWPLGDVVQPRALKRDQIGVFAFSRIAGGVIAYMPVMVVPSTPRADTGDKVVIVLRSTVSLNDPAYRFTPAGQVGTGGFLPLTQKGTRLSADLSAGNGGSGTLEVRWTNGSGMSQARQFTLTL